MSYTILIVDDDKALLKMLKSYLEIRKYSVLTAEDGHEALKRAQNEPDRVNGLLSGGDDYILKPFSLKELEARIIAHLKREERHRTKSKYRFLGELSIDYTARTVQVGENCLELTKLEYDILEFLSMHPGQVFDRERIYERICGYDGEGDSRVVTELVRRIRKKLKEYTKAEYIETVWGMGYRWGKE